MRTLLLLQFVSISLVNCLDSESLWHSIEGKILPPDKRSQFSSSQGDNWISVTQILLNYGEHVGFVREDGSFVLKGVPAGSYILDVVHPSVHYESARVDITSKGKIRARKVNHLQPSHVTHVPYPLRLAPLGGYRYFQAREQWRVTDILFSPMVLMMVLPLILIIILPKMMSDPETRREMENVSLPKYEMPEMSEMLTSFFGKGKEAEKPQKTIKSKKNN